MSKSDAVRRACAVILLGAVTLAVAWCGTGCEQVKLADGTVYRSFMQNTNLVRSNTHSQGVASMNPFRGMLGSAPVTVQDADGNTTAVTTADKLRNITVLEASSTSVRPSVSYRNGPVEFEMYGTRDQTSWVGDAGNVVTNLYLVKWLGRVWVAMIDETGATIKALNR